MIKAKTRQAVEEMLDNIASFFFLEDLKEKIDIYANIFYHSKTCHEHF
jgi:hypothetical protein